MLSSTIKSQKYQIVTNANLCFIPTFVTHSTYFIEYVSDWFNNKLYLYQNNKSKISWDEKLKTYYTIMC